LLGEAYLVSALQRFSRREVRRRSSPPKLVPLNNAFLSATEERMPSASRDPQRWGRWVENACLAFVINAGQAVHYWREAPLEVDAVVDGTWGKWVIEVKTGPYGARDLSPLFEFVRRFRGYRPLVVCDEAGISIAQQAGIPSVSWSQFLWSGVEGIA
jgi:predicted AAA+ superfamily ATPase